VEKLMLERKDAVLLAKLTGEVTLDITNDVKRTLNEELGSGVEKLVMDLSNVDFMDSSGIGLLVSVNTRMRSGGKFFYLYNPSPQVEKTLNLVQLFSFFEILSGEDELQAAMV
jgi:anti-sigma B factor antagonist